MASVPTSMAHGVTGWGLEIAGRRQAITLVSAGNHAGIANGQSQDYRDNRPSPCPNSAAALARNELACRRVR